MIFIHQTWLDMTSSTSDDELLSETGVQQTTGCILANLSSISLVLLFSWAAPENSVDKWDRTMIVISLRTCSKIVRGGCYCSSIYKPQLHPQGWPFSHMKMEPYICTSKLPSLGTFLTFTLDEHANMPLFLHFSNIIKTKKVTPSFARIP